MPIEIKPPLVTKMLVPVDFSPCSEKAFRVALQLARIFQCELILMHVVDTKTLATLNALGLATLSEEEGQKKRLAHRARLNARLWLARDEVKGVAARRLIVQGSPFVEIARAVRAERVDLVVMGTYGGATGNVEKIFFGSTAEKVVRAAGCPVLCVPLSGRVASATSAERTAAPGKEARP